MRRAVMLFALVVCSAIVPGASHASRGVMPPCDYWLTPTYEGTDARVRLESIGGRSVFVLVPPGYDQSAQRYPVVYLIHGGVNDHHAYLSSTDVADFTAAQPPDRQAIVVMPEGTLAPALIDWRNGANRDETLFLHEIVPFIDAHYRTIPDRSHRAIAGYSAGALGASLIAARHPDLFGALGSFSGLVNLDVERGATGLGGAGLVYAAGVLYPYCYGEASKINPFGMFGDPILEPVWIHDGNPSDLAANLSGTSVTIYSGNGQPCDRDDIDILARHLTTGGPESPPWGFVEAGVRDQAVSFSEALTAAGVPHSFEDYGCGIHSYRYVERDVHHWWSIIFSAFDAATPTEFDFRDADSKFAVWDWTFEADQARASEFLDVADVSATGLTLTGSGIETSSTAGYFQPGDVITLTGAVEPTAIADDDGRITFHVDLGPAHQFQQYTIPARVLEALGGYWTSRTVSFST